MDGIPGEREIDTVATPDFLNSGKEPAVPPHKITLAVGSICRLTRNFDVSRGLTKNTRVIVRRKSPLFRCSVIYSSIQERVHIPRIVAWWQPKGVGFKVLRKQLPLVLSYAATFNGCQGLTVQRLALDLRRPVFSHGQLYSAMSRVPNQRDVLVLRAEGETLDTTTTNIVWKELLIE
ncbi:hypothetical protein C8R45DRAFT_837129 [Mycena sanguinolenta]|nr:hypothetical protein C8R45DRAFT_837129 [Mycena sanguinolenta]